MATFVIIMFAILCFFYQNSELEFYRDDMVMAKVYSFWNSLGGGREYLPLETDAAELNKPNVAIAEDGTEILVEKKFGRIMFDKTNSEQNVMKVPLIYYYGYVADIIREDGSVESLELKKDENAIVEVVTEGKTGNVRVWYNGTKIQKISYLVSAFSALLVVGILIIIRLRKNKK